MGGGKKKRQRQSAGIGLSFLLWFAFSMFALMVVVVFVVVQNSLVTMQYRERTRLYLEETGETMVSEIGGSHDLTALGWRLLDLANENGLTVHLFYEDGESVFTLAGVQQADFSDLAAYLREKRDEGALSNFLLSEADGVTVYAHAVEVEGRPAFLYLAAPTEMHYSMDAGLRWISLVTALAAVVLAFVVSGIVEYARTEISRADVMQKELIANVSHDFKTPLTMIKAYASMIREISGDNKQKRDAHAKVIFDECDRLTLLVSDLLDLSKLRAGLVKEERTAFDLSEEVRAVAERFSYLRETEGLAIEEEIADGLFVTADKDRIAQVLYNLIGNAVNYTGEDDKRIRIRLYVKGKYARFEVIDTGKGIPADEVDTIWDRYYRSGKTHKRPVSGTGLGLSIVKSILLQHDFPFGVISEEGKGSCFWVEFPIDAPAGQEKNKEEGE